MVILLPGAYPRRKAELTPAMIEDPGKNRRKGAKDRRERAQDRRNAERVADDVGPRRLPDIPDRRNTTKQV
ncbi:MAG: hypothetical protein O7B25_09055 [Gammaproteobacteria bacterium]|nr:hypothetical protein [Gammaproteobacteria bacterium]